jgi:hypothetical protein
MRGPLLRFTLAVAIATSFAAPALAGDPGRIDAYVTPYYNSSGPISRVGTHSAGLASKSQEEFVATIVRMKKRWERLTFAELYVGAIRLYDWSYRDEATYWFYSAQYRGRQFALLVDQKKMGGIGDPGFELYHAQDAFFQLAGPYINGYAFGDIASLAAIVRKVQNANRIVPNMQSLYPGVSFVPKPQWQAKNVALNAGLGSLADSLPREAAQIERQRTQNGTTARFAHLTNRRFPGGL